MVTKDYIIPIEAEAVTLEKYQRFIKMIQTESAKDDMYYKAHTARIMWDMDYNEVLKQPEELISMLASQMASIFGTDKLKWPFINRFFIGDVEFGFVPNLDRMSFGEFIDLDKYMKELDTYHKAMSILYRPIKAVWKDTYEIETYRGTDKYAELMKEMPSNVAIGAEVFFYHLSNALRKHTVDCSLKLLKEAKQAKVVQLWEESGAGIMPLKLSLGITLLKLQKRLNLDYMDA